MQIITEKGLLRVDKSVRPQVFETAESRGETQSLLVRDLLDRAFGGSPARLILRTLSTKEATPEERREIRALLDELEEESR